MHNCGECDRRALDAVEAFSYSQDVKDLSVSCDCLKAWKAYLTSEQLLGTASDLDRGIGGDLVVRK